MLESLDPREVEWGWHRHKGRLGEVGTDTREVGWGWVRLVETQEREWVLYHRHATLLLTCNTDCDVFSVSAVCAMHNNMLQFKTFKWSCMSTYPGTCTHTYIYYIYGLTHAHTLLYIYGQLYMDTLGHLVSLHRLVSLLCMLQFMMHADYEERLACPGAG